MIQKNLFPKLTAIVAIVTAGLLLNSCKPEEGIKPTPSYTVAKNFVGTFVGISGCDTGAAMITINAGVDQHAAFFHTSYGTGNCKLVTTLQATINGDSLTIPFQEYQDHCFTDYSVSGGAIYRNDSIFLAITTTYRTELNVDSVRTCGFMGRKLADDDGHNEEPAE